MKNIQVFKTDICYKGEKPKYVTSPCLGKPCWFCNEIVINNLIGICEDCKIERCPKLKYNSL